MNNKTEQQIKERIDDAGLAELLPDFDWDATWQQIEHKMQPRQPWWSLRRIMTAAAVLLLGLFLAVVSVMPGKNNHLEVTAFRKITTPAPQPVIAAAPAHESLSVSQPAMKREDRIAGKKQQKNIVAAKVAGDLSPALKEEVVPAPVTVVTKDTLTESVTRTAAVHPVPRKVRHFLDIDNEDHSKMHPEYPLVRVKIFRFPLKDPDKTMPSHHPADLPLRTFIYAATN